jgi:hypothetical protein
MISEAKSRANSAEGQRSVSVAESDTLIGMIEKERDDLTAVLGAVRTETARDKSVLAQCEIALAEASCRADDLAETLHQVVLATHDAAVDPAGRIASLRGNPECAQQEARERAAAADAAHAEVGTL